MSFLTGLAVGFFGSFVGVPILLGLARLFQLYTIVEERKAHVYVLFGKVRAVLAEPGIHALWLHLGPLAPFFYFLGGKREIVDLRLDQSYLRSQPVNSEEGAPMGIGVWYEMVISDPVSFLFKNADPRGSLRANVASATARCLSNMKLNDMLQDRHAMSLEVREAVSRVSVEWGYTLGSVYVRKVHFRDLGMIKQIEEKVVNRLRQVTSAIRQDGANQVSLITSTAEREAAVEFARAAAVRPRVVGEALRRIASEPEISRALFELLELQQMLANERLEVALLPAGASGDLLAQLVAARPAPATG
jgi:regulator of protease activity HflC (stomatin/prohibitin superfamily)